MSVHISNILLSLYLDGRASHKEREAIGTHLSDCKTCNEGFLSLKTLKGVFKGIPQVTESEGFDFEFRRRLKEELAKREKRPVYQEKIQDILGGLRLTLLIPRPVLVRAVAVITIAAFLTVSAVYNQLGVIPAIASVKGDVEILKDNRWQRAEEGMKLRSGEVIKVAKESRVNIESKKYEILLKENTKVKTVDLERPFGKSNKITYGLNEGKMLIATKKGFEGSDLKVDSPLAEVEAKGTGFLVDVSPAQMNKTWVGVLDGEVEVRSKIELAGLSSKVMVETGKATEIRPDSAPTAPRYLLEEEWKEIQEIYRIGEQPQVALLISMTPRRVHELLRPAGLYITDKKTKAMPRAVIGIINRINEAIKKEDKERHLKAIHDLEDLIEKYPDPRYNVQFLFFIAGYYYYIDEYEKSIEVLGRITKEYPSSNLVSLALCAEGLIYEKELNDPSNAVLTYNKVLTDYPQSLEAEEAAAGLNRLK